jgi:hypothetical protein
MFKTSTKLLCTFHAMLSKYLCIDQESESTSRPLELDLESLALPYLLSVLVEEPCNWYHPESNKTQQ